MGIKRRLDVIMAHIKAARWFEALLRGRKKATSKHKGYRNSASSFHVKFLSCPAC
jgi:hypothetical protein